MMSSEKSYWLFAVTLATFIGLQIFAVDQEVRVDEVSSHCAGAGVSFHSYPKNLDSSYFVPKEISQLRSLDYCLTENLRYDRGNGLLYATSLFGVMKLFGTNHRTGRIFSILIGLAILVLFKHLLKQLNFRPLLINVLPAFLAFNSVFLMYSGTMRSYVFSVFFILLVAILIFSQSTNNLWNWKSQIFLIVAVIAACLSHFLASIVIGGLGIIALSNAFSTQYRRSAISTIVALTLGMGAFAMVLMFFSFNGVFEDFARQEYWTEMAEGNIPHSLYDFGMVRLPSLKWLSINLGRSMAMFLGIDLLYTEVALGLIGFGLIGIFPLIGIFGLMTYAFRFWRDSNVFRTEFTWFCVPVVWLTACIAISILKGNTTIFFERYLVLCMPFALIPVGFVLDKMRERNQLLIAIGVILVSLVFTTPRLIGRHLTSAPVKQDYKYYSAAEFVVSNASPTDTVVFSNKKVALISSLYLENLPVKCTVADPQDWNHIRVVLRNSENNSEFDGGVMYKFN